MVVLIGGSGDSKSNGSSIGNGGSSSRSNRSGYGGSISGSRCKKQWYCFQVRIIRIIAVLLSSPLSSSQRALTSIISLQ